MDNCGIRSVIEGTLLNNGKIKLKITSDCEDVQELAEELAEVDLSQIMQPMEGCIVYQIASICLRHPACLVPAAIVRTVEVETGIALPGKSYVSSEKL